MKTIRLLLCGLGNVGRSFLTIMQSQAVLLRERYDLELRLVGAVDSAGAAVDPQGIDPAAVLAAKSAGSSVAHLARIGHNGTDGITLARQITADILLEATPVNLRDGLPGLEIVRSSLRRGIHCVLANKAPLALAYTELAALSDIGPANEERGDPHDWPALRFSACVGGALPTINIGVRDLAGAHITRVEAVLNGTTQGILRAMEAGESYAAALADMQQRGIAETDPTLDVEGWDAANKLVILANAVLRQPTTLADLTVRGILDLTAADLQAAAARGERIVLLGLAEQHGAHYRLSVAPTALPAKHPLARMDADEMGVVYYSDIAERQAATSAESGPLPTAAAMLRDVIDIAARRH
ncbi:MAG TPA: homoserine dehydrogenase [Roseiflexaceae bacterium]|nr:homoserine dehydrogenase [Roseiflexaceae bacterium]HMP40072.1 homoserine dehydrogenase [Roseiflexaceae bacterium]